MNKHLPLRLAALIGTAALAGSALVAPAQATNAEDGWRQSSRAESEQKSAAAAGTGRIAGRVRVSGISSFGTGQDEDAEVVVGVWPAGERPESWYDEPYRYKTVTGNGTYAFSKLAPGKYFVGAMQFSGEHEYLFYKQQPRSSKAKLIRVTKGKTSSGIEISLKKSARISGTVKNSAGETVAAATVTAYDQDGQIAGYNGNWDADAAGRITVRGIPSGAYKLRVRSDAYPEQWYGGIDKNGTARVGVKRSGHTKGLTLRLRSNPAFESTGKPTVSGTRERGRTLTASEGSWDGVPSSYSYRWLRNGSPIGGATAKTYKLTKKDVGKRISVRVGAVHPDTVTGTRTSSQTGKIKK